MSETIAFLGLGNMGTQMAQRLLDAGYPLRVYNRTPSKAEPLARRGAQVVDEPRAAVESGGIAITSLANDAALEEVTLGEHGFLDRLGEGGLHLSTSTVAPATAARFATLHEQRHSMYLAAPVLGRPEAVAAGQLGSCSPALRLRNSAPSRCCGRSARASSTSVNVPKRPTWSSSR